MSDDFPDDYLTARIPVSKAGEIAHLLGRIEQTLIEMRRDIQEGTRFQAELAGRVEKLDGRVGSLESDRSLRVRIGRFCVMAGFALLLPAINAVDRVHQWFDAVDKTCFPKG